MSFLSSVISELNQGKIFPDKETKNSCDNIIGIGCFAAVMEKQTRPVICNEKADLGKEANTQSCQLLFEQNF